MGRFEGRFHGRFNSRFQGRFAPGGLGAARDITPPDLALFSKYNVPGFLHNFARTDRTWQESAATTLADDPTEAVAFAAEESQWNGLTFAQIKAMQTNLVSGAWTLNTPSGSATVSESPAGTLNLTGDGTNTAQADKSVTTETGAWYAIEPDVATNDAIVRAGTTQGGTNLLTSRTAPVGSPQFVFQASGTTSWIRFNRTAAGLSVVSNVRVRKIPGNHAIQSASTSFRPVRQAGGLIRFDGSDDNLLTTLNPAVAMTLAVRMKPTSAGPIALGARQVANGRGYISTDGSTGKLGGGVGAQNTTTITGGSDIRNTTGVAVLTWDGSTVNLYWNGVQLYTGAQSGTPDTAIPIRLGAFNDNGVASSFFAGDIYQALAIQAAITPGEVAALSAYWSTL